MDMADTEKPRRRGGKAADDPAAKPAEDGGQLDGSQPQAKQAGKRKAKGDKKSDIPKIKRQMSFDPVTSWLLDLAVVEFNEEACVLVAKWIRPHLDLINKPARPEWLNKLLKDKTPTGDTIDTSAA